MFRPRLLLKWAALRVNCSLTLTFIQKDSESRRILRFSEESVTELESDVY